MQPTQLVGIALADVEITAGDFDGAIETTEDIENEDDATAMMLVLRGIAFREKGLDDAALECFKRAIAKKDRTEGVIHRGLYERAMTYKKLGKKAAAKKDLEKILVDDPQSAGVNEALAAL
jgi:tetratricopeptide (TPR) repeat protein